MRIFKAVILVVVVVLPLQSCEKRAKLSIECEFYSGLDGYKKAPAPKPLAYYLDSVSSYAESYQIYEDSIVARIDTTAFVLDHAVVDLMFEIGSRDLNNAVGKMVLIETDPGLFQLLYAALAYPGVFTPSRTISKKYNEYEIVYTKSRYQGQMTHFTEAYWIYNYESNCFARLDYSSNIKDTIEVLLPDSCFLGYQQGFAIDSLFWSCYISQEGDHYRWPTCGRIKVWFRQENCVLVPDSIVFDPEDKAPH